MATTTQRGLGWQHQKQRKALLAKHRDGDLCEHCGEPMFKTQPLQADHSVPRSLGGTKADRLLHAWCNESRGNGTRVPTTASDAWTPGITSRDWLARTTPAEKSDGERA